MLMLGSAVGGWRGYRLFASGAVTIDVGVGRRVRRLGPVSWQVSAAREVVFDVIAGPYLGRTPRALEDKLQVWERGSDMVLAAHHTRVKCGVTTTVETSGSSGRNGSTSALREAPPRMSSSRSCSGRPAAAPS